MQLNAVRLRTQTTRAHAKRRRPARGRALWRVAQVRAGSKSESGPVQRTGILAVAVNRTASGTATLSLSVLKHSGLGPGLRQASRWVAMKATALVLQCASFIMLSEIVGATNFCMQNCSKPLFNSLYVDSSLFSL